MNNKKALLFSAPSGCGKTTIIGEIMKRFDCFEFSISATSRNPRPGELDGVHYYFLSPDDFKQKVADDQFLEWEEVYQGTCYGTLKSEVERIWNKGKVIIFDVDVNGGKNLKKYFGSSACSIFVMPPSIQVLENRLRGRGTEKEDDIQKRLNRSAAELEESVFFDFTIVNDELLQAVNQTERVILDYLNK